LKETFPPCVSYERAGWPGLSILTFSILTQYSGGIFKSISDYAI